MIHSTPNRMIGTSVRIQADRRPSADSVRTRRPKRKRLRITCEMRSNISARLPPVSFWISTAVMTAIRFVLGTLNQHAEQRTAQVVAVVDVGEGHLELARDGLVHVLRDELQAGIERMSRADRALHHVHGVRQLLLELLEALATLAEDVDNRRRRGRR